MWFVDDVHHKHLGLAGSVTVIRAAPPKVRRSPPPVGRQGKEHALSLVGRGAQ